MLFNIAKHDDLTNVWYYKVHLHIALHVCYTLQMHKATFGWLCMQIVKLVCDVRIVFACSI